MKSYAIKTLCLAATLMPSLADAEMQKAPQKSMNLGFTITGENCGEGQGCIHLKPREFHIKADFTADRHLVLHGSEGQLSELHIEEWGTFFDDAIQIRYRVAKSGLRLDYAEHDYEFTLTLQSGDACQIALDTLKVEGVYFTGHLSDIDCLS